MDENAGGYVLDIDNNHIACQPLSMWDHTGCSNSYAAMIGLPVFHIAIGIEATAAIYNRKKLWTPITVLKGYLGVVALKVIGTRYRYTWLLDILYLVQNFLMQHPSG